MMHLRNGSNPNIYICLQDRLDYIVAKQSSTRAVARARSERVYHHYMINLKLWMGRSSITNWHVPKIKRRKILQNVFASDISRAGCFVVIPIWRRDGEDSSRSCWTLSVHAIIITAHRIPVLIAPITLAVMAFYSRNGKAVGSDSIPIEAWKSFSSFGVLIHTEIFNHILNTGKPLHQWWLSFIIPIYKGRECSGMW